MKEKKQRDTGSDEGKDRSWWSVERVDSETMSKQTNLLEMSGKHLTTDFSPSLVPNTSRLLVCGHYDKSWDVVGPTGVTGVTTPSLCKSDPDRDTRIHLPTPDRTPTYSKPKGRTHTYRQ